MFSLMPPQPAINSCRAMILGCRPEMDRGVSINRLTPLYLIHSSTVDRCHGKPSCRTSMLILRTAAMQVVHTLQQDLCTQLWDLGIDVLSRKAAKL